MQYNHLKFEVDMVFLNLNVFKKAMKDYAIYEGKPINLPKNHKVNCKIGFASSVIGQGK